VLCKAPYPNTRDSRVAQRLDAGQWGWYYRAALRTVIQACGRVVRAPDDHGATYLADSSLLDLFERARGAIPPWFADQVDRLTRPDLPEPSPERALAGGDGRGGRGHSDRRADNAGRTRGRGRGRDRDGSGSDDHPLSDVWD